MNYVEAEYDGAAPPRRGRQVHLEEQDLRLLWKLFDYALISSTKSTSKPVPSDAYTPNMTSILSYDDADEMDFLIPGGNHTPNGTSVQATDSDSQNNAVDSIFNSGVFNISYGD